MSVHSKLQNFAVDLVSDHTKFRFYTGAPQAAAVPEPPAHPRVSCLMVTRGNIELLKHSFACYQRQTYANRELVIVAEPEAVKKVHNFIASQEPANVRLYVAPPGLSLGDHRNFAVARATGNILATWDDDDLSDPRRLEVAVQALRQQTDAAAVVLSRVLLWWPQRKLAAITHRRTWEQSMVVWRNYLPIYPARPRNEDAVARDLVRTRRWAAIDSPLLYVYVVTGRNTWDPAHFEEILSHAECRFEGDEFDELNQLLSHRLSLLDYAAVLTNKECAAEMPR